ncbi:MAG: aspartate carbamoyltransferase [Candidatus Thermoplasmatota archaeon]
MSPEFKKDHVVAIDDFTVEEISSILDLAEDMIPIAEGKKINKDFEGKILATLFFEPSTRTRLSFEAAMKRMGGRCIGFARPGTSSAKKGETLADTIRVAAGYADMIVLRHPQEGAAQLASNFSDVPVINAGDGAGHHPTQTLLDLFTIREEKGSISDNHIGIAGDLKYGRTVHSLTKALSMFESEMTFISPSSLKMPEEITDMLKRKGIEFHEVNEIKDTLDNLDLLYMTRIQRERFPSEEDYQKVAKSYHLEKNMLENSKNDLKVMHPLPRVDEIKPDVDDTPNARYFEQASNGVPTRMALLKLLQEEV